MSSKKKKGQSKKKSSKKKNLKQVAQKESFFSRAKENFQKKRLVYTYVLGFLILVGIFAWIQNSDWFKDSLDPVLNLYASISSVLLNLIGQGTTAVQQTVDGDAFSVNIKQGCDAIAPMLLYLSAVVLYPISAKWKWQGLLGGLSILFVLNIIRIVTLYLSGAYGSIEFFDFMHIEFWQVLYIILTVFVWLVWIRWASKKQAASNA